MSDSLMVMIGIFLAVILMFIFPLMSMAERNVDISQTVVQTEVSKFVDKVSVAGKIRASDYDAFVAAINATNGAPYDVEIEIQHLDDNFSAKVATVSSRIVGENARYSSFTTEVKENMYNSSKKEYTLKKGDNIIVTVKNTNTTMAAMLRNAFYQVVRTW